MSTWCTCIECVEGFGGNQQDEPIGEEVMADKKRQKFEEYFKNKFSLSPLWDETEQRFRNHLAAMLYSFYSEMFEIELAEAKRSEEILLMAKTAICESIYSDDGLDGGKGQRVIKAIDNCLSVVEQHELYKDGDEGIPNHIKDRNGRVVLDYCKKCRKVEVELECPCIPANTLNAWSMVMNEELVMTFLGVADETDSYDEAKRKVGELINWHIAVATDPKVNGGFVLFPEEPSTEMLHTMMGIEMDEYPHAAHSIHMLKHYKNLFRLVCGKQDKVSSIHSKPKTSLIPKIHVEFYMDEKGVVASAPVPVKYTRLNDDGSISVALDYFPEPIDITSTAEQIQRRNIDKVVRSLAELCFGSKQNETRVTCGSAHIAIVNSLTAKDGLNWTTVGLEPLPKGSQP